MDRELIDRVVSAIQDVMDISESGGVNYDDVAEAAIKVIVEECASIADDWTGTHQPAASIRSLIAQPDGAQ